MKKIALKIKFLHFGSRFSDVPHTGYTTGTPGLAVCRKLRRDYRQEDTTYTPASRWWEVIHIASGFPIGPEGVYLTTRKDALIVAHDLRDLADWTAESSELTRNLALRDQAYAVFEPYKERSKK